MPELGTAVTTIHVFSGILAVIFGFIALCSKKGSEVHKRTGRLFVVAMIVSSLLGSVAGALAFRTLYITTHAGVLSVTLLLTSWQIIKVTTGERMRVSLALIALSGLNTAGLICVTGYAAQQSNGVFLGFHATDYGFLVGLAGVAFMGELSIFKHKSVSPRRRLMAHLWRMCCGFFIAAGSAFTGPGAQAFPESIQETGLLSVPEAAIFLAMLYWLFRVWRSTRHPLPKP